MDLAVFVLDRLKAAGYPAVNVVLPSIGERRTWRVQLAAGSSPEQQTAADAFVASLSTDAAALLDADADKDFDGSKIVKAVALWAAQRFGVSPAAARSQIVSIYKGLP